MVLGAKDKAKLGLKWGQSYIEAEASKVLLDVENEHALAAHARQGGMTTSILSLDTRRAAVHVDEASHSHPRIGHGGHLHSHSPSSGAIQSAVSMSNLPRGSESDDHKEKWHRTIDSHHHHNAHTILHHMMR